MQAPARNQGDELKITWLEKFRNSLKVNLFGAIRLLGTRVRSRGGRFIRGRVLLVAGDRPPAILISRELAHLRAMLHAALVGAMAVAQRCRRHQPWGWRLIRESCSRNRSQQDCCANGLTKSTGSRFHHFILKLIVLKTDSAHGGKLLVFKG